MGSKYAVNNINNEYLSSARNIVKNFWLRMFIKGDILCVAAYSDTEAKEIRKAFDNNDPKIIPVLNDAIFDALLNVWPTSKQGLLKDRWSLHESLRDSLRRNGITFDKLKNCLDPNKEKALLESIDKLKQEPTGKNQGMLITSSAGIAATKPYYVAAAIVGGAAVCAVAAATNYFMKKM